MKRSTMKRKPTLAKLPPPTKRATKIIYRCTKCNFNTRHPARLTQHITSHSNIFQECKYCVFTSDLKASFEPGPMRHECKGYIATKIHHCTQCDFRTSKTGPLHIHMETHEKPEANSEANSEGNKEQANNESKEITNLILQHYETDYSTGELRKYGEAKVCTLRQSLHNENYAWDIPNTLGRHSFYYSKGNKCWLISTVSKNNKRKFSQKFVVQNMPRSIRTRYKKDPYPPLGEWVRGRPYDRLCPIGGGETTFTLELELGTHVDTYVEK